MDTRPLLLLLAATFSAACGGGSISSGTPFACGAATCEPGTFCVHEVFVGNTFPDVLTCSTFPSGCEGTANCDCLAAHPGSVDICGPGNCTEDAEGHVTFNCQAP